MKKYIWVALILMVSSIFFYKFVVAKETYIAPEYPLPTHKQKVWLHTLQFCESRGREVIKIMDSNNRYSYGLMMFQMETFMREGKKYGILDKGLTVTEAEKIIYNIDLQEKIAHQMLLNGGERNWYNCWTKKMNKEKYPIN